MTTTPRQPSVIAALRALMPNRPLTRAEAYQIAEQQATKLLQLSGTEAPPVAEDIIAGLPRVMVERHSPLPMSGFTNWNKGRWQIVLNGAEPWVRQKFSLAHEFKHVLDHPFVAEAYTRIGESGSTKEPVERVCDYFAGCLLMPKLWVTSLYYNRGVRDLPTLARRFGVSQTAMRVRLLQLGLIEPAPRCRYSRHAREVAGEPPATWISLGSLNGVAA